MIQRKQSLFLLQLVVLALVLMFIPCMTVLTSGQNTDVSLMPINHPQIKSSGGHYAAIAINGLSLVLSFLALFMYKKREQQRKLCFVLAGLWAILTLMFAFCPFVEAATPVLVSINMYAYFIGILGFMGAILAAKFIKRDIELLKSAERIR